MFEELCHAASLPYVIIDCFRSPVVSLVHSRLDYGNFILVGLPAYLQRRLLNAAACLVFRLCRYDHVTDALTILRWLRLTERVNFKVALMEYRVLHGMAPVSLRYRTCRIVAVFGRHLQLSAVACFLLQHSIAYHISLIKLTNATYIKTYKTK